MLIVSLNIFDSKFSTESGECKNKDDSGPRLYAANDNFSRVILNDIFHLKKLLKT